MSQAFGNDININETPQKVKDIIKEFQSTDDEDIKYMVIKKPVRWITNDDLLLYFYEIIKPVLENGGPDIINLLAFEILPNLFQHNLELFMDLIYYRLMKLLNQLGEFKERKIIILQCIKAILELYTDREENDHIVLTTKELEKNGYVSKMIEISRGHGFDRSHKILYREILKYLFEICYDKVLPFGLFKEVLQTTSRETRLDTVTCDLLRVTINLVDYKEMDNSINDMVTLPQLEILSQSWNKFNKIPIIYHYFLETFTIKYGPNKNITDFSTDLKSILTILEYFQPFFIENTYSSHNRLIRKEELEWVIHWLIQAKHNVQLMKDLQVDEMHIDDIDYGDQDNDNDDLIEEDAAQQNYLNELQSGDGDEDDPFTFENDSDDSKEHLSIYGPDSEQFNGLIIRIDTLLQSLQEKDKNGLKERTVQNYDNLRREIQLLSKDMIDLNELQDNIADLEILLKNCETRNNTDEEIPATTRIPPFLQIELYQALLPKLKKNKEFVKILKVGNMKQKIDEGQDVRLTIYTILVQTEIQEYTIACMVLDAISQFAIKEKDPSVLSQIGTLYRKIVTQWGNYLEALDPEWLEMQVIRPIIEQNLDLYNALFEI